MTRSDTETGGACRFATTCWTVIYAARAADPAEARRALEALCRTYWYPLYAFIRRQGHDPHDAQDLTQGFLARLLDKDDLARVDPVKGKFRSWLMTACTNYLRNQHDRAHARKRLPAGGLLPLDLDGAEGRYAREPAHALTPEALFDRRWALTLLGAVLARLEAEAGRAGKGALYGHLKPFLVGEPDPGTYARAGAALEKSEAAVKQAAFRFRKRYRALLREEIGRTVADPAQVDEEIRDLFAALGC